MVYLLNRDVVEMIDEYILLHDPTGFCPFMIMDKCIINAYKPTACQMYMPFDYHGRPMCYYLANETTITPEEHLGESIRNSNSYAIHGFMMLMQNNISRYFPSTFFKNIYEGTRWWKNNYQLLPQDTIMCLESVLTGDTIGRLMINDFQFEESLLEGDRAYNDLLEQHERSHEKSML